MSALPLAFRFVPSSGEAREIRVSFETQQNEKSPLRVTIDWGDDHPDRIPFPGPPLSALGMAARYVALRIRSRVETWGGGTVEPEVEEPPLLAQSSEDPREMGDRVT